MKRTPRVVDTGEMQAIGRHPDDDLLASLSRLTRGGRPPEGPDNRQPPPTQPPGAFAPPWPPEPASPPPPAPSLERRRATGRGPSGAWPPG